MAKVSYTDAPTDIADTLESTVAIDNFLPPLDQLVLKRQKEKITIAIDKHSLELFKQYAEKHNAKCQIMINSVVTSCADKSLAKK